MAERTEQAAPTDRDLDIHLGCAISAFIPVSCFFLSSASYLMIGALLSALMITLLYARLLFPILPPTDRMRWLSLTAVGAIASWLIYWNLRTVFVLGNFFESFEQLFRRSDKSLISTLQALFLVGMASTTLIAVSSLPIAGITWLVLRKFVPGSHRKVFLVAGLCSTLTGFILSFYLWGTRLGWN